MKIKDIYIEYIEFTPLSERTKEMYKYCFTSFWINKLGNMEISEIDYDTVQNAINLLIKKYSYNTVKIYKAALYKVLWIAELKNKIDYTWKKYIYLGQRGPKKTYDMNLKTEFTELMIHLSNSDCKNQKSYMIALWIGFFTGMRIGEVFALEKEDVDIEGRKITVTKNINNKRQIGKPKTPDSYRNVYICTQLKEILSEYLLDHKEKILLPDSDGHYIAPNLLSCYIRNWCRPRKYHFHFHALRVMFVKIMLEGKANPENIRAQLGHANVSTTLDIYARTNSEYKNSEIEQIMSKIKINDE